MWNYRWIYGAVDHFTPWVLWGSPEQRSTTPAPCLPLSPYSHKFISVPKMKTLTCSGPISREITNVGYCKIPLERRDSPPLLTETSPLFSLRACWFRTNIGYQSHLAACRLFCLSYILGLVKPPAIKHTLLQSRAHVSPLSAPTRVHKLLGCAPRVTAFNGAKKGKNMFVLFICSSHGFALCLLLFGFNTSFLFLNFLS